MNRDEFLEKFWSPYPEAGSDWIDVAEFCAQGKPAGKKVAGRLTLAGQMGTGHPITALGSAGAETLLRFPDTVVWMEPQATVSAQAHGAPEVLELLKDGDLILVEGESDLAGTVHVARILLLAPSASQPARHSVPPLENLVSEFSVHLADIWSQYLSALRFYFSSRGFVEATTPTLVPSPGTEPYLEPFHTSWNYGSQMRSFYLPTSPEFHLKQLLVRGATKVYEIKPCFRNGEIGPHHQPEFLMLEWYRAYSNLNAIADDVDGLLKSLSLALKIPVPALTRATMPELFQKSFPGFQLTPHTTREELAALAAANDIRFTSDDSFDDLFFRLFLEKIEGGLGADGPQLVSHYPPSQAALSRIGKHGFAERFEVYWRGLELANAFHELNDPIENETRFLLDAKVKKEMGKTAVPRDENLVAALHYGMPPSGGIALGVDRLFMALMKIEKIEDTRAFPIRHS